ncbi:hypothetical protein J437_LFUL001980 [Ladona fulva]|uniref:AB hydrolase-1 domain-containing protein n=1 Tax=Ladona fulva TaxID=123851 RepID=A0A8K0JWC6_LADFU|nr:hypothetical protein J437_LFUL001980 [Ladona fulva]
MNFLLEDWTGPINYYRNLPFIRISEGANGSTWGSEPWKGGQVLLMSGGQDNYTSLESVIHSLELLPKDAHATVRVIPGAGHLPHQENPDVVNNYLLDFLHGMVSFKKVVALDLKGFGDSDKPSQRHCYRVNVLLNELHEFINSLGVSSCVIIGHDLGALLGWLLIYNYPGLVTKFVALSCPHPNIYWDSIPQNGNFSQRWVHFSQLPYLPEVECLKEDLSVISQYYNHVNGNGEKMSVIEAYKYSFSRSVPCEEEEKEKLSQANGGEGIHKRLVNRVLESSWLRYGNQVLGAAKKGVVGVGLTHDENNGRVISLLGSNGLVHS